MLNLFNVMAKRLMIERKTLEAFLVALLLIVAAFPDVLFNGASLRLTDQITGAYTGVPLKPVYPIPNSTGFWAGYNDNGGATYQSEPMIQFMANSMKSGESPYWNPYSAAGSLGPEALVDQKFSAVTLLSAALGGKSLAYNVITLIALYFGVFFVYRIVREIFGLSSIAAAASSVFYLLNGYITANLGSNVTQSYFYVPVCLYTALMLVNRFSVVRWSMAVLAFTLFFSCTFMPTTITSLIAIAVVVAGFLVSHIRAGSYSCKVGFMGLLMLGLSMGAALLLLAPLYFPFLENLKSLGTLDDYSKRIFWPLFFPRAIASFFSSSHFFESYNATEAKAALFDGNDSFTGNTVFHCGIVAIGLMGCAFSKSRSPFKWLITFCVAVGIFILIRLFDPVWIRVLFSYLPIVGNIGSQYWWPVIMFPMVFLIGFGVNNIQEKNVRILPSLGLMALAIWSLFKVYSLFGLQEPNLDYKIGSLIFIGCLIGLIVLLLLSSKLVRSATLLRYILTTVVIVMFVELLVLGKMIRFERNDLFTNMPPALKFIKDRIGTYRTLNFGQGGLYPELGSAFKIQEVSTMNQGGLPAFRDFFYSSINLQSAQRLGYHTSTPLGSFPSLILIQDKPSTNTFNWDAIDFLGVKYLILPVTYSAYRENLKSLGFEEVYDSPASVVFENKKVLPRSFSIPADRVSDKAEVELPENYRDVLTPAIIDTYKNTRVTISGEADQKSLVVLSDTWHSNWKAMLNGKEVPIIKVNKAFRGVIVPPGHYHIQMKYRPKTLSWAIASSAIILMLLLGIVLGRKRLDTKIRQRLGIHG